MLDSKIYTNRISIIIPVFNESDCIEEFMRNLLANVKKSFKTFEIILVDDGSTDDTAKILNKLRSKELKISGFSVNRGQSAAMYYGVQSARYEICATLDADGQNDPEDIIILAEKLKKGTAVCGIRVKRKDYFLRKLFSFTARALLNIAGGVRAYDPGCTLKVFYREDFINIPYFNGMHRFIPYLLHMNGVELTQVPVRHHPRIRGKSKYGLWSRTFRVFFDIFGLFWLRKRANPYYKITK